MNTFVKKGLVWWCFFAVFACVQAWGQRTTPLDVYIIVDSSAAMEKGKDEAVSWLCETIIDGITLDGDRISIWTAGIKPELLYSSHISADSKKEAKKRIRGISFSGSAADYKGALQEAQAMVLSSGAQSGERLTWTVLVSGTNLTNPPEKEAESAELLRYSRVESFSGWRVLTVGLDVGEKVRQSAASYMRNR